MITRIVILNSATYGKAAIRFDDCDSIQLVGPNNIGKSTLVFALNFLLIVDGKKMTFVDNKTGDKETIHHYLPTPINSYIVFEVFKHKYYCILLKRNNEGEVEYYKFDGEYSDDLFTRNVKGQQNILKFDDLKSHMANSGIELTHFKDKREVFQFVYQRGKRNDGVVWLEDNVVSDGLSNNFSKIYRYLINSKLINNKTLKEALIVADNRDKEGIDFSHRSKKDINDLLRVNDEIKAVSGIQKEFLEFREVVDTYRVKTKTLGELIYTFNTHYAPTLLELEKHFYQKQEELQSTQFELNEELMPKKEKLLEAVGAKGAELKQVLDKQNEYQKQLDEINQYEGVDFLKQQLFNYEENRRNMEVNISLTKKTSEAQVKQKLEEIGSSIEKLKATIKDYSGQLIHTITTKQKDKEILNYILSPEFSSLPGKMVKKKIAKIEEVMALFDGKIELPKKLKGTPVPSLDELKEKLNNLKKEEKEYEALLKTVTDTERAQKEVDKVNNIIEEIGEKLRKLRNKPELETIVDNQKKLFKAVSEDKIKLEKETKSIGERISKKLAAIPELSEARDKFEKRIEELKRWKVETEKINIEPLENANAEPLNQVYDKITVIKAERDALKANKDRTFDNLKYKIKSGEPDEEAFIRFVEDELALMGEKQKSVETLLQSISTQFANPAYTLIKRYREFSEFVNNKFNGKLAATSISDIESLRIILNENTRVIEALERISSIQEFSSQVSLDFDNSENLKVLNTLLDSGKKIDFDELFDIELGLTKDGKEKIVDLREQVESTGTDIMIRMVIIMSVINRLAINDANNKIPIAIDEIARIDGKNRLELFKFCKEHNFIPVCTSTEETMLDGFDKYVLIFRAPKGKKVNINDGQPNVISSQRIAIAEEN